MILILGLAGVGAIWVLGRIWLRILGDETGSPPWGVAYGLGLLWVTTTMGLLALMGLPLSPSVGLPVILCVPVIYRLWSTRFRVRCVLGRMRETVLQRWRRMTSTRDLWWWMATISVGLLWSIVVMRVIVTPGLSSDAWSNYSFKAKAIYVDQTISKTMLEWVGVANYPLGVTLQEVWMAWVVGRWNDVALKLLFPGYLMALWALAYGALRERLTPRLAMLGTLFVAGSPLVLQHGLDAYTDLPLAYFTLGQGVALLRFATTEDRRHLAIGAFFGAGAIWSREDGPIIVAAFLTALSIWLVCTRVKGRRVRWHSFFAYVIPAVLVWAAWMAVRAAWGISANLGLSGIATPEIGARMAVIFDALISGLFLEGNWLLLWPIFFLVLTHAVAKSWSCEGLFLALPVLIYIGGICLLAVTTGLFDYVQSGTVLNRLILHVAPLAALWVALVLGRQGEKISAQPSTLKAVRIRR